MVAMMHERRFLEFPVRNLLGIMGAAPQIVLQQGTLSRARYAPTT